MTVLAHLALMARHLPLLLEQYITTQWTARIGGPGNRDMWQIARD